MEFHYYYIIQDVVGVLISVLALKLILLYSIQIWKRGLNKNSILCVMGNAVFMLSGIILMISPFGFYTWIKSICLFVAGYMFGKIAYREK